MVCLFTTLVHKNWAHWQKSERIGYIHTHIERAKAREGERKNKTFEIKMCNSYCSKLCSNWKSNFFYAFKIRQNAHTHAPKKKLTVIKTRYKVHVIQLFFRHTRNKKMLYFTHYCLSFFLVLINWTNFVKLVKVFFLFLFFFIRRQLLYASQWSSIQIHSLKWCVCVCVYPQFFYLDLNES